MSLPPSDAVTAPLIFAALLPKSGAQASCTAVPSTRTTANGSDFDLPTRSSFAFAKVAFAHVRTGSGTSGIPRSTGAIPFTISVEANAPTST